MSDVWRISVDLLVGKNDIDKTLAALGMRLRGVNSSLEKMIARFGSANAAAIGLGLGIAKMGELGLKGLVDMERQADRLQERLVAIKSIGGWFATPAGQSAARSAAYAGHFAAPTASAAESAHVFGMIAPLLSEHGKPNLAATAALTTELLKAQQVLAQAKIAVSDKDLQSLLKSIDLRGKLFNPKTEDVTLAPAISDLNALLQSLLVAHGQITPSEVLARIRQSAPAARGQSRSAYYGAGMEVSQSLGAGRTGTAEMGLFQQLVGGIMPVRVADELVRQHFLKPGSFTAHWGQVVMKPGFSDQLRGDLLKHDPEKWILDYMVPTLEKRDHMNLEKVQEEVFRLFGRSTVARYVMDVIQNQTQLARGRYLLAHGSSIDTKYTNVMHGSQTANIQALTAAWETFESAFATPLIQPTISGLHLLTSGIDDLTKFFVDHPGAARATAEGLAGIAGVLTVGGTATAAVALGKGAARVWGFEAGDAFAAAAGVALPVAIAAAVGPLLWKRPDWLPKWLDETPGQLAAQIGPVLYRELFDTQKWMHNGLLFGEHAADAFAMNVVKSAEHLGADLGSAIMRMLPAWLGGGGGVPHAHHASNTTELGDNTINKLANKVGKAAGAGAAGGIARSAGVGASSLSTSSNFSATLPLPGTVPGFMP